MIRIAADVLQVADSEGLFEARGEYCSHERAVTVGLTQAYDRNRSLDEKAENLNRATNAEINKFAGPRSETVISERIWQTSAQYRWAAFAVVTALVDMVIPDVVADVYGRFSETRNIGYG